MWVILITNSRDACAAHLKITSRGKLRQIEALEKENCANLLSNWFKWETSWMGNKLTFGPVVFVICFLIGWEEISYHQYVILLSLVNLKKCPCCCCCVYIVGQEKNPKVLAKVTNNFGQISSYFSAPMM